MITKYVKGDICDTELDYIAHGVNCQNKMGSGVAKALYERYPRVKERYHKYYEHMKDSYDIIGEPENFSLLGDFHLVEGNDDSKTIINCFTQNNYGYDGKKYIIYWAISQCFYDINRCLKGEQLAIPKIGCGLAGGDWHVVEALINEVTPDIEIWVYEL